MSFNKLLLILTILLISNRNNLYSQEKHYYQTDFTISEFEARRSKIFKEIGDNSIALIQGGASIAGFKVFRQTNTFYYLCGIEEGHAYLLLNGKNKSTTIYLPRREKNREQSQGKILSFDDADLIKKLTGIKNIKSLDFLGNDLVSTGLINGTIPTLYTPFSPAEMGNDSRDEILSGHARAAADPWDSNTTRESRFIKLINERFPEFEIKNLSPLLDSMRLIKSSKEIEIIGLYDPAKNGLDIKMWSNSNGDQILNIFKRINKMDLSKDASEILNILLLTNAHYPEINISREQFLELKSNWLIKNSNLQLIENYILLIN